MLSPPTLPPNPDPLPPKGGTLRGNTKGEFWGVIEVNS